MISLTQGNDERFFERRRLLVWRLLVRRLLVRFLGGIQYNDPDPGTGPQAA